ncbi:alpha/beta fold hydrolase [Enterobacter sp. Bisph1]|uniref:alpha/beta fold hydrolase n=1 Tax=Enterobacter sp. Bisph1 TaxID=1274399 RepID=UPI00057C0CE3|nr:alpha/beta fold hydrolase [Enterobacter sp. Bisph1]
MNAKPTMSFLDSGTGFPVLLGHSYLFDKSMWSPQIATLSEHFRVIVPDLWGHGDSSALPGEPESLADIADDHLALMDSLNIEQFAVVGLSVGGMWGAELAVAAPDRVRALMLLDTFVGSETDEARERYFGMLNAIDAAGSISPALVDYIVGQFYSEFAEPADIEQLNGYLSSLSADTLRHSILPLGKLIFGRTDRMSILDSVVCPAHVATGKLDLPRPPAEGRLMAQALGCEFTLISNAAHISNRENPAFVTRLIVDFLSQHL